MNALLTTWFVVWLACHVGAHVALVGGLFARRSILRAILSVFVPPLAPYWGWEMGMRKRAIVWTCALFAYAAGLVLAPS